MRRTIVMTAVITLLGLAPAAAATTTTDAASGRAALAAYDRYLHNAVSAVPAWQRDNDAFVASISTGCQNVLAGLAGLPPHTVNETALFDFGVEIGGDLAVVGAKADLHALATLRRAVSPLPWSNPQTGAIVRRFVDALTRLSELAPSHLCDHARALAAANGAQTPRGTIRWATRFVGDTAAEVHALAAFIVVLKRFETPADSALVHDLARVERRLSARRDAAAAPEIKKIVSALGLPS